MLNSKYNQLKFRFKKSRKTYVNTEALGKLNMFTVSNILREKEKKHKLNLQCVVCVTVMHCNEPHT